VSLAGVMGCGGEDEAGGRFGDLEMHLHETLV
jgi:hypothetical protein